MVGPAGPSFWSRVQVSLGFKKTESLSDVDEAIEMSSRSQSSLTPSSSSSSLASQALDSVVEARPTGESGRSSRTSWNFDALNVKLQPGFVQNRAYILVTEPLLDTLLEGGEKLLPLPEKAKLAKERVDQSRPLLSGLYKTLGQMFQPGADVYALREQFFDELGKAYKSSAYKENKEFRGQLQEIGRAIFTKTPLYTFGEDATRSAMEAGGRKPVDIKLPISEILEQDRKAIESAPEALTGGAWWAASEKMRGHCNVDFLPTHRNNPTHQLHTTTYEKNGKAFTTECLRFGSPTIERERGGPVEISPAFLLFLDSLRESSEKGKLLSFQHQNPDPEAGNVFGGKESQRLEAMVDLAQLQSDVLTVVTLPMDGPFFKGKKQYEKPMQATEFVQEFKVKMQDPAHAQLPEGHQDHINKIIDQVHEHYFQGEKRPLTREERQIFQMITYAHIEKYFIGEYKPQYYHSQCKDAMDRAMSLNVISYFIDAIAAGQENNPKVLEHVRTMTHMAPLIVKGIGMHGERFRLLKQVLDFLEKMPKESLLNGEISGIKFVKTEFAQKMNQFLSVPPSSAENGIQYQERMLKEVGHSFHVELDQKRVVEEIGAQFEIDTSKANDAQAQLALLRPLLMSRYDCPKAQVILSRPSVEGQTFKFNTNQYHFQIEAKLSQSDGMLNVDWTVKKN